MTTLAVGLAILAVFLFLWSYAVYPFWIARRAARTTQPPDAPAETPFANVEAILSAADEEAVIAARVRDLLAQAGVSRITIGCDGSGDATAARAREAAGYQAGGAGRPPSPPAAPVRVRIVEFPQRRGKAAVLNDLIRDSTAELLVFTDANTRFDPGAVAELARACAAPRVGAACGRLVLRARRGRSRNAGDRLLGPRDAPEGGRGPARRLPRRQRRHLRRAAGARHGAAARHDVDGRLPDSGPRGARGLEGRVRRRGGGARGRGARRGRGGFAAVSHRHRRGAGPPARALALERRGASDADLGVSLAQGGALAGAARGAAGGVRRARRAGDADLGRRRAGPRRPARAAFSCAPACAGREGGSIISPCSTPPSPRVWPPACSDTAVRSGRGRRAREPGRPARPPEVFVCDRRRGGRRGDRRGCVLRRVLLADPRRDSGDRDAPAHRQRALHARKRRDGGRGAVSVPLVLRALPRPGALPRAARAPARAGPPGRAADARLDLLPGPALLVSPLGPGPLRRLQRRAARRLARRVWIVSFPRRSGAR